MLMLHWRQSTRVILVSVVFVIALAACGGGDDTPPTPFPSVTALPTITVIPTWTPIPSSTPWPTITPAPTMTSAVGDPTFPPPAETGLGQVDDQVIVTILEADLNQAITQAYSTASIAAATAPPVVSLEAGYQLVIMVTLTNEFLNEESTITMRVLLQIEGGQIRLKEVQEKRYSNGPKPSDRDLWQVIDVVEQGINRVVFDLLSTEPGAGNLTLVNLRLVPDSPQIRARLEAFFAPRAG